MSKLDKYPKEFDVQIRLSDSFCWLDGMPVYVYGPCASDDYYPAAHGLVGLKKTKKTIETKEVVLNPNDSDLDARPFKIGWSSTLKSAKTGYLMRQPQRSQRAGMNRNNTTCFSPDGWSPKELYNSHTSIFMSMLDMYEDFEANLRQLEAGAKKTVSFSKDFAAGLVRSGDEAYALLYYRYFPTGVFNTGNRKLFMQQGLDEKVKARVCEFVDKNEMKLESF